MPSNSTGFYEVQWKSEGTEHPSIISAESILITGECNWIQFEIVGVVNKNSSLLKDSTFNTQALRVNFLVVEPSGLYETGNVVTWTNNAWGGPEVRGYSG